MLEQQPEARDFDPAPLFPDAGPEELARQVAAVREWLKGLPLGRRPLVQVSALDGLFRDSQACIACDLQQSGDAHAPSRSCWMHCRSGVQHARSAACLHASTARPGSRAALSFVAVHAA